MTGHPGLWLGTDIQATSPGLDIQGVLDIQATSPGLHVNLACMFSRHRHQPEYGGLDARPSGHRTEATRGDTRVEDRP
jgi:hypothetical protein